MATRPTYDFVIRDTQNLEGIVARLNAILAQINDGLMDSVSRTGRTPNDITADLDLSDQKIINISQETDIATKGSVEVVSKKVVDLEAKLAKDIQDANALITRIEGDLKSSHSTTTTGLTTQLTELQRYNQILENYFGSAGPNTGHAGTGYGGQIKSLLDPLRNRLSAIEGDYLKHADLPTHTQTHLDSGAVKIKNVPANEVMIKTSGLPVVADSTSSSLTNLQHYLEHFNFTDALRVSVFTKFADPKQAEVLDVFDALDENTPNRFKYSLQKFLYEQLWPLIQSLGRIENKDRFKFLRAMEIPASGGENGLSWEYIDTNEIYIDLTGYSGNTPPDPVNFPKLQQVLSDYRGELDALKRGGTGATGSVLPLLTSADVGKVLIGRQVQSKTQAVWEQLLGTAILIDTMGGFPGGTAGRAARKDLQTVLENLYTTIHARVKKTDYDAVIGTLLPKTEFEQDKARVNSLYSTLANRIKPLGLYEPNSADPDYNLEGIMVNTPKYPDGTVIPPGVARTAVSDYRVQVEYNKLIDPAKPDNKRTYESVQVLLQNWVRELDTTQMLHGIGNKAKLLYDVVERIDKRASMLSNAKNLPKNDKSRDVGLPLIHALDSSGKKLEARWGRLDADKIDHVTNAGTPQEVRDPLPFAVTKAAIAASNTALPTYIHFRDTAVGTNDDRFHQYQPLDGRKREMSGVQNQDPAGAQAIFCPLFGDGTQYDTFGQFNDTDANKTKMGGSYWLKINKGDPRHKKAKVKITNQIMNKYYTDATGADNNSHREIARKSVVTRIEKVKAADVDDYHEVPSDHDLFQFTVNAQIFSDMIPGWFDFTKNWQDDTHKVLQWNHDPVAETMPMRIDPKTGKRDVKNAKLWGTMGDRYFSERREEENHSGMFLCAEILRNEARDEYTNDFDQLYSPQKQYKFKKIQMGPHGTINNISFSFTLEAWEFEHIDLFFEAMHAAIGASFNNKRWDFHPVRWRQSSVWIDVTQWRSK